LCWIETKIGRATNPIKALEQAITAQATRGDERMPVAICKNNRGRTTVTLQVEDFAWLLEGKLREGEGA